MAFNNIYDEDTMAKIAMKNRKSVQESINPSENSRVSTNTKKKKENYIREKIMLGAFSTVAAMAIFVSANKIMYDASSLDREKNEKIKNAFAPERESFASLMLENGVIKENQKSDLKSVKLQAEDFSKMKTDDFSLFQICIAYKTMGATNFDEFIKTVPKGDGTFYRNIDDFCYTFSSLGFTEKIDGLDYPNYNAIEEYANNELLAMAKETEKGRGGH